MPCQCRPDCPCPYNLHELLPSEYTDQMAGYLVERHMTDIEYILNALDDSSSAHYSVSVNLLDLLHTKPVIGTLLLHHPAMLLDYFNEALEEAQRSIMEHHDDQNFMSVKKSVHVRPHHLPRCAELWKETVSSIRAANINSMLSVSGTVIRTGQTKMLQYKREYECAKCAHRFTLVADMEQRHQMPLPPECPSHDLNAKPCHGTKFEFREGSEKCRDYQEVRIQEQVHRLTVGSIPRSITLILQDDLVDLCSAGDDVTIVGMLRKRWKPLQRDQRPDVELAIEALHVHVNNNERGAAMVSREMQLEFEAFWRRHAETPLVGRDLILRSACPQLAGMYVVKLATLLTLVGGVTHTDVSGLKVRGESHMLLVGDPGTGKSQVLRYAAKLSPRAVLTTGIGSTSAGLTCTAVRDTGGEWMLEAGALVLADGGLCCIDEFNSIRESDRLSIHEAMEQQTLSVAKAGLVCKLRTKCSIFAACNPKGGKYDAEFAAHINIGLPSPLLSRFDVVLLMRDEQDPERDAQLTHHILQMDGQQQRIGGGGDGGGCGGGGAVDEGAPPSELWGVQKLRAYLEYVRSQLQPEMTPEAESVLVTYYSLQRQQADRDTARTTIRMLESLVRLAQAHARLMWRKKVERMDAIFAVLLSEVSSHTAAVMARMSALRSEFMEKPDESYKELEKHILQKLGLADGDESGGGDDVQAGGAGGGIEGGIRGFCGGVGSSQAAGVGQPGGSARVGMGPPPASQLQPNGGGSQARCGGGGGDGCFPGFMQHASQSSQPPPQSPFMQQQLGGASQGSYLGSQPREPFTPAANGNLPHTGSKRPRPTVIDSYTETGGYSGS